MVRNKIELRYPTSIDQPVNQRRCIVEHSTDLVDRSARRPLTRFSPVHTDNVAPFIVSYVYLH